MLFYRRSISASLRTPLQLQKDTYMTSIAQRVLALLLVAFTGLAQGAAFTPGNLVVYRVGDGSGALSGFATAVFLDEITTAGTLVQSIALLTVVSGAQKRLTASGSATSEGLISRSADGACVVVSGYDAATGTASVTGTSSATTNRVIGVVSASGLVDTSTAFNNFSGNNIRSAASTDCNSLWATGANDGVRYVTLGGTTTAQVSSTVPNLRQINIFGGQLFVSTSSGSAVRVGAVGSGLPTTTGQTTTNLPGLPTTGSPYSFFFADLSGSVAGIDTLYVADDTTTTGGIQKYSLVGGTWVSNGTLTTTTIRGLTGIVNGTSVALYGDGKADILWKHTDGSIYAWLMNGLTIPAANLMVGAGTGWSVTHTGDLNGDGKDDILFKNTDGSVYGWTMNGLVITTGGYMIGPAQGWSVSHVRDLDGDGKADILLCYTDGLVYGWLMNGLAINSGAVLLNAGSGWSVSP